MLPEERDPRFIAVRRGGTLTDGDHHLRSAIRWSVFTG